MDHKNNQEMTTEESNENVRTLTSPAEDMEFSQYSNTRSEDRTQGNVRIHNMNQYSNATTDDIADQEQVPQDKVSDTFTAKDMQMATLGCECGQCSSADEDNAKIAQFEKKAKDLRNSNSDLVERMKSLQSQMRDLVKMYHNLQGDPPPKGSKGHPPWSY